jgi:hypothetical protein
VKRVRTDNRWDAGVGVGGGKLVYGARSTSTSLPTSSRPNGANKTPRARRSGERSGERTIGTGGAARGATGLSPLSRLEERRGLAAAVLKIAGKSDTEGLNNFRTPAAFSDPGIVNMHYSTT